MNDYLFKDIDTGIEIAQAKDSSSFETHRIIMAFIVFSIASLPAFYDGKLAREGGQETAIGRFLDPLADKFLVTSALVAFVFDRLVSFWLVMPIVTRDVVIMIMRFKQCPFTETEEFYPINIQEGGYRSILS